MRALLLVATAACGSKLASPPVEVIDLSSSTAELAAMFDAHADQPRLVAILSPT